MLLSHQQCPAKIVVKLVGSKWKPTILWQLSHGGLCRFGDLLKSMKGISQKVLTQSLRAMEADGLITRKVYAEVPPRVEYSMTDIAHDLTKVLDVMGDWGIKYVKTHPKYSDHHVPAEHAAPAKAKLPLKSGK